MTRLPVARHILLIMMIIIQTLKLSAQAGPGYYAEKWKLVDTLISRKGQTTTALSQVNSIYQMAKKEKNDVQLIKSLIYRMHLQEIRLEDAELRNIAELQKEAAGLTEPSRSILKSILGESLWQYYQQNRWNLYNRTKTINYKNEDISTWGAEDFRIEIGKLYLASLTDEKVLQQTSLSGYDPILIKGNVRHLRPTLYDLLAHRALDYFKNDEEDFEVTTKNFELDDPVAFSGFHQFAHYRFHTTDSTSLHFTALRLFQRLLRFHELDTHPDALLDVDIERINFVNSYALMENRESLYLDALKTITAQYGNEPGAVGAWYLIAEYYANNASTYDPLKDTTHRYDYLEAIKICEKIVGIRDSSEPRSNARELLGSIRSRSLQLKTEKVNVPGQPFLTLVSYKNLDHFYLRVLHIEGKIAGELKTADWTNESWKTLLKLNPILTSRQELPNTKDYQEHRVEIKTDSLPVGEYALLASSSENFTLDSNILTVAFFNVSDIAYINNGPDYFVLHRESGQPISRADVQVWYKYYDNKQNKNSLRMGEHLITDKNGAFIILPSRTRNTNEFLLECTKGNDHLFLDDGYSYSSYYRNSEEISDQRNIRQNSGNGHGPVKTILFTDRSIYRPGQLLFFKGIVFTKDMETGLYKVVPGFKTKLLLYDANGQRVDSLFLVTGEFGSYRGSFKLPEGRLNGEFRIEDSLTGNSRSISVEEYKRPRFFVGYDSLQKSYNLGDTIKVTAFAKAYAGNAISGGLVKFRVMREARFPYPWRYVRWGIPNVQQVEIVHGETKTDQSGRFSVIFKAFPDRAIQKDLEPVFIYRLSADVTDINGETRSEETTVQVGYKSLEISVSLPGNTAMPVDRLQYFSIQTKSLNGEFVSAPVDISMYRLSGPGRLIRERYWEEPDQFVMGKEEFLKYFPRDEYSHESDPESWEKKAKVFEKTDTTKPGYRFPTGSYPFIPGWYVIEVLAHDKTGQEVKDIQYIQLFDSATGRPGSPGYIWANQEYREVEPGTSIVSSIGSSGNNLFVIRYSDRNLATRGQATQTAPTEFQEKPPRPVVYDFIPISNEQKTFSFNIGESDRGGFGLYYAFVKNNRFYKIQETISVPWTNKELHISYLSYREKTLPGSQEKWKIKVSGTKANSISAEILTAMYDGSLDQFKEHTWVVPNVYPEYTGFSNWNDKGNFEYVSSEERYLEYPVVIRYERIDDQLMGPDRIGLRPKPGRMMEMAKFTPPKLVTNGEDTITVENAMLREPKVAIDFSLTTSNKEKGKPAGQPELQIRRNFNETAFFLPDLQTDSMGNVEFSFTMPEALTRWKWMTFAHTRDLAFGLSEKSVITQKQLMVQPNMPRFLREGDHIDLSAKIANLTDSELTGQVQLQLVDPTTNQSVDGWFQNLEANQYFTVGPGESGPVSFNIQVPFQYDKPLTYRIVATANRSGETLSDGEESMLPVISNRTLVTETMPITVRGTGTKKIHFEKLLQSGTSETLNNYALTLEFTGNPTWYALQALPWIMESPDECSEQAFDRFYANALASRILGSSPAIREVFDRWRQIPDSAENFLSALGKNQELKTVVLQETPWVMEAKEESQQKKYLATLVDPGRVSAELNNSLQILASMQFPSGGFPWFSGGPDDRFITQYILTGIGRLKKMNAIPAGAEIKINSMVKAALAYLDKVMRSDYERFLKTKRAGTDFTGPVHIQYLYMRSFFPQIPIPEDVMPAVRAVRKEEARSWVKYSRCLQAMVALSMHRAGQDQPARDILASLKENSISEPETGVHWKQNTASYFWYGAPVETQCVLIEAFSEISGDSKTVDEMKTWLLTQKRTQAWSTTKATADACYALIMQGSQWLSSNPGIRITLGDKEFDSRKESSAAGTGYFKERIDGPFVKPEMGDISVTVSHAPDTRTTIQPAWGAVYWQYFDQLDKVTSSNTSLRINKKIFLEKNERGSLVLEPAQDNQILHPGDRVRVRIEIRSDRDLEFVHMKDLRASCLEPVTILSGYHYQDGLGYYESVRDVSTDFFFNWLPRGTHVFEYPMVVAHTGNFSNGMANIQCMYAPEFSGHSEGIRLNVENQVP